MGAASAASALAAQGFLAHGGEGLAFKQHLAAKCGGAGQNAQYGVRQQAFAGTTGTNQGYQLTTLHRNAYPIEHRQPFAPQQGAVARKAQVQVLYIKHGFLVLVNACKQLAGLYFCLFV